MKPSIGGASTATINDAVGTDKLAVTLDLSNLEVGEGTSLIASALDDSGIATGANLNLKVTATTVSSDFSANTDVTAGESVSLGTIASPSGTVTINWDIVSADCGPGDVTYKFTVFDGSQYADVHTFVLTLTDAS